MKTIRKDWPRVRQYVKAGNTYFSVDLRRKHYKGPKWKNFTRRDKALEYASEIGKKVAKSGTFKADFKDAKIKEINRARIEEYLKKKDVSSVSG